MQVLVSESFTTIFTKNFPGNSSTKIEFLRFEGDGLERWFEGWVFL